MYVVYIYDRNKNLLNQIFNISDLTIQEKLNDIATASFIIENKIKKIKQNELNFLKIKDLVWQTFLQNEWKRIFDFQILEEKEIKFNLAQYRYFKEWNFCKINILGKNWNEKTLFEWIISWARVDLEFCEIHLVSELFLLKKKILIARTEKYFYKDMIQEIVNQINQRDPWFIKQFICEIDVNSRVEFSKWKSLFDALKDLAWDVYEFYFKNWILFFWKSIWRDRTFWNDLVFFEYNILTPESNTIIKAEVNYDIKNISNSVFIDNIWEAKDNESISEFGILEENFNKWSLQEIFNENKKSLKEFNIEPISTDYFLCNIWDIVKVRIETWSDMLYFDWNLKVVEKSFRWWELNDVKFKLNSSKMRTKDIFETISDLKSKTKNL